MRKVLARLPRHQLPHLHAQPLCQALQAPEGKVPFSSLQSSHVGTVHSQDFSEGFLGQALGLSVGTQVPTNCSLEVTFCHVLQTDEALLEGLQTYE